MILHRPILIQNLMKQTFFSIAILLVLTVPAALGQEPIDTQPAPELEAATADPADIIDIEPSVDLIEAEEPQFEPETRYVADEFFVPLRETPCPRCKIVHWGIKSGTQITLTNLRDGWGLVETSKGYKGWMEEQFIALTPSGKELLEISNTELVRVKSDAEQLNKTVSELEKDIIALEQTVSELMEDKQVLNRQLADVVGLNSDPVALNEQNQTLVKQNHILQSDNDVLIAEVEILENDRRNQSYLYGGLTVFLGALLVVLIPRLKGRKRLSEWG